MLDKFKVRFESILEPDNINFNPVPAAACLMDPNLAACLLDPELDSLRQAVKLYVLLQTSKHADPSPTIPSEQEPTSTTTAPALKRFKFLATKLSAQAVSGKEPDAGYRSAQGQLNKYMSELLEYDGTENSFLFWRNRRNVYSKLAPTAEDLISAPASQAYVERIFSLCGLLSAGRRNRMEKSLEMRVFLKLNKKIL